MNHRARYRSSAAIGVALFLASAALSLVFILALSRACVRAYQQERPTTGDPEMVD